MDDEAEPTSSRRALLAGGAGLAGAGLATAAFALGRAGEDSTTRPAPAAGRLGPSGDDDRPALQAAIDAAAADGGGVVALDAGRFALGGSLHLRTAVTLWGAGPGTVLALGGGLDVPALVVEDDVDGEPVAYAAVRDLTLDGATGTQTPGRHGIAIRSDNSGARTPRTGSDSFPLVADVTVVYFGGHGVAVGIDPEGGTANVRGARLSRVTVFECAKAAAGGDRAGILVAGSDGVLVACDVAACDGPGFDVVRANNRLEACKAYNNLGELRVTGNRNQLVGCQAQDGRGDGFVLGRGGDPVGDLTLVGCQADSNAGAGFRLDGVTSSSVVGLSAFVREGREGAGPGVVMDGTSRCLVSGTVRGYPVAVEGENVDGITQLVT